MNKSWLFLILFFSFVLAACNNQTIEDPVNHELSVGNPIAEEILSKNKDADIFVYGGRVYQNAEDIDWINSLDLKKGQEVTKITAQTLNAKEFENGTATKLPIGTKIYEPVKKQGPILIAVVNGKEVRYLGLVEG
jgi:hypothetical protein